MRIRKATQKDISSCAKVQRLSEKSRRIYSKKDENLTKKYLKRYLKNDYSTILVAEDNKNIIGYIVFSHDEWNNSIHIDLLFVRLDKQKQGIGSKLIQAVINQANKMSVRILFLETRKNENKALKFYKKNRFSKAGYINDLYKEKKGNALVLSRKLS